MAALILVLGILSAALGMGVTINSLMFIILPIMENQSLSWLNHILFWPSLAISAAVGRKVFWWVIKFLSVEETQEVKE